DGLAVLHLADAAAVIELTALRVCADQLAERFVAAGVPFVTERPEPDRQCGRQAPGPSIEHGPFSSSLVVGEGTRIPDSCRAAKAVHAARRCACKVGFHRRPRLYR